MNLTIQIMMLSAGALIVLFCKVVTKAVAAIAPLGVSLGVAPKMMVTFISANYGYFILPTYASELACIGFDRSGTTRIGKFIINHSFIIPGLIGVGTGCTDGYILGKVVDELIESAMLGL